MLALVIRERRDLIEAMNKVGMTNADWGKSPSIGYGFDFAAISLNPTDIRISLNKEISGLNSYTNEVRWTSRIGKEDEEVSLIQGIRESLELNFEDRLIAHLSKR